MRWFYGTPEWAAYLNAFDPPQPLHTNDGPFGNLIITLEDPLLMWRRLSKGHRSHIRRIEKSTSIIFDEDGDHFDIYQMLHELDAGRRTRPQQTFDIMKSWQPKGMGLVVVAVRDHLPIGAAYFIKYVGGSYYASAARDPNLHPKESPAHLILWKTMCRLQEQGHNLLDLGPVPAPDAEKKEKDIASFKAHFGAAVLNRASGLVLAEGVADYLARVAEKELA